MILMEIREEETYATATGSTVVSKKLLQSI